MKCIEVLVHMKTWYHPVNMCFVLILHQLLKLTFAGSKHFHLCTNCDFKLPVNQLLTINLFTENDKHGIYLIFQ